MRSASPAGLQNAPSCARISASTSLSTITQRVSRSSWRNACPDGIDVYFENVGGHVWDAVFPLLNEFARVPVCGLISQYNAVEHPGPNQLPVIMRAVLSRSLTSRGFIQREFADQRSTYYHEMAELIATGEVRYREDIIVGLENAPKAFMGLLEGRKFRQTHRAARVSGSGAPGQPSARGAISAGSYPVVEPSDEPVAYPLDAADEDDQHDHHRDHNGGLEALVPVADGEIAQPAGADRARHGRSPTSVTSVTVKPAKMPGSASGTNTSRTIVHRLPPMARAASISPRSTSRSETSAMRA